MRLNRPLTAALAVLGLGLASPMPAMAGPPHADPPRAGHGPGPPRPRPGGHRRRGPGRADLLQQRARPDALPGLEHLLRSRWRPHRGRSTVGHRPHGPQWPAGRRLHLRLDRRQLGRAHPAQRGRSARRRPGPLPRRNGRAGRVHPQQGDEGRHLHRRRPVPAGAVWARQQRPLPGGHRPVRRLGLRRAEGRLAVRPGRRPRPGDHLPGTGRGGTPVAPTDAAQHLQPGQLGLGRRPVHPGAALHLELHVRAHRSPTPGGPTRTWGSPTRARSGRTRGCCATWTSTRTTRRPPGRGTTTTRTTCCRCARCPTAGTS